jgi:hypothetical protein
MQIISGKAQPLQCAELLNLTNYFRTVTVLLCSRYYEKEADTALARGCDTKCLQEKLCEIATAETGNSIQCNTLMKKFQEAHAIVNDGLNLSHLLSQIIQ